MEDVSANTKAIESSINFEKHFDVLFKKFFSHLNLGDNKELEDTPRRFYKALQELTSGYKSDPRKLLSTTFQSKCDDMVVIKALPFNSLCEHHLMPFWGFVDIGYIPQGKVAGLSKFPRAVQALAHRLQLQERLTQEIRDAINEALKPLGVIVVARAIHTCMRCRGVRSTGEMITSSVVGLFKESSVVKAEFFSLLGVHHE